VLWRGLTYRLTVISSVPFNADKISESGRCFYISGCEAVISLFFRLGSGWLLNNVLTLVFRNPIENSTAHFATSSPRVCLTVLLNTLLLH
jgi:hypothetical protein